MEDADWSSGDHVSIQEPISATRGGSILIGPARVMCPFMNQLVLPDIRVSSLAVCFTSFQDCVKLEEKVPKRKEKDREPSKVNE